MIVFDGLYSFVSIGLSGLAVLALRFVRRGPDDRFPWGREAAEPLVVILKAATLGALCVYAAVGGVVDLLNGGREVEVGWAIVYALIATAGSLAVGQRLRYGTRSTSPQVRGRTWFALRRLSGWATLCSLSAYSSGSLPPCC